MKYQVTKSDNNMEVVATMREVCELIGKRVSKKDVVAGLVDGVSVLEEVVVSEDTAVNLEPQEEITENTSVDNTEDIEEGEEQVDTEEIIEPEVITEEVVNEPIKEEAMDTLDEEEKDTEPTSVDNTADESEEEEVDTDSLESMLEIMRKRNEKAKAEKKAKEKAEDIPFDGSYPEIGTFTEVNQLKKFYKKLADEHLDEWLELEGWISEYKPSANESINRMRKCLIIRGKHFPSQGGSKSKSKYADYTTEDLMQMAIDNDVVVKDAGDMRILRMYLIVALRKEGLLD